MSWRTIATAALVLALAWGGATPAEAQKKRLSMGCTATASSHFAYCVGQAKAINTMVPEVDVTVVETGATVDNLRRMLKSTIDYGLITNEQVYLAQRGEATWKDNPFPDVRNLWYYTVSAVYIIVREEAGIKALADLGGKKFSPGFRGSATEKMTETTLTHLGIKADWVRGGASDLVDAIKDKRIVGYAKAADGFRLDASMMDIATTSPIRVLGFSDEQVKKVKEQYPYFPWVRVPANSVKGMGEFWAEAVVVGFAAPKSLPNDVAYKLVKAVMEDKEHQRGAFKGMADDMAKVTLEQSLAPLHAGAIKYFREKGLKIPDQLIPAEAK
ncbi:MAG TPA: TAXI family TRAP transporter solute-binding subunit [Methylomirabilota bacterium]|nr:TAXI family TRAP transporter solute-binding subunit [Methylomirabilota bacterium]